MLRIILKVKRQCIKTKEKVISHDTIQNKTKNTKKICNTKISVKKNASFI